MLRLTAIVPATNSPTTLETCLAAIGATDAQPDQLVVVRAAGGAGPAAARNAGAAQATGDILVFVDADICVHRDVFVRVREAFAKDDELAALFGSYDDAPAEKGVVSVFRNLLHHHVHQSSAGPATTFWGGVGALRADVFRQSGGFDEERFSVPCVEDIELGMRIAAGGGRIVLDPQIQGTHLKAWTLGQMIHTDLWRRGVPWTRLLLEQGTSAGGLNLRWQHRLSTAAVVVGASALVLRRPALSGASLLTLVLLNRSFYGLLLRRRGPAEAVMGVGLHAVHHLTAAAAVPIALAGHHLDRRRARATACA